MKEIKNIEKHIEKHSEEVYRFLVDMEYVLRGSDTRECRLHLRLKDLIKKIEADSENVD